MADGACFLVVVIVHVGETCTPIFVKSPRVSFFFLLFSFFITVIIFLSKLKDSAPGQNFSQDSYQAYVGPPCAQQYGKRG